MTTENDNREAADDKHGLMVVLGLCRNDRIADVADSVIASEWLKEHDEAVRIAALSSRPSPATDEVTSDFYATFTHPTELGDESDSASINVDINADGLATVDLDDLHSLLNEAGFILSRAAWIGGGGQTSELCGTCGHGLTGHRRDRSDSWCQGNELCACEGYVPTAEENNHDD